MAEAVGIAVHYAPLTLKCRERKFPDGNYSVKSLNIHKVKSSPVWWIIIGLAMRWE